MRLILLLTSLLIFGCGDGGHNGETTVPPVVVPGNKVAVDLFIIYGQSNGSGSASSKSSGKGLLWWNNTLSAKSLQDPTRYDNEHCDCGSAWPAFGDAWFKLTGRLPLIMNVSRRGADIETLTDGPPFATFESWYNGLLLHGNFDIKSQAVIFVHGETDAKKLMSGTNYKSNLFQLYNKIKRLTGDIQMFTTHVPLVGGTSEEIGSAVASINHKSINFSFAKSAVFHNGLLEDDNLHFNQNANELLGNELAKNIWMKRQGADITALIRNELVRIKF